MSVPTSDANKGHVLPAQRLTLGAVLRRKDKPMLTPREFSDLTYSLSTGGLRGTDAERARQQVEAFAAKYPDLSNILRRKQSESEAEFQSQLESQLESEDP